MFLKHPNNKYHLLQAKYDSTARNFSSANTPKQGYFRLLYRLVCTDRLHPQQRCSTLSRPAPTQSSSLASGNWPCTAQPMFVFKEAFHPRASLCENTSPPKTPKHKSFRLLCFTFWWSFNCFKEFLVCLSVCPIAVYLVQLCLNIS